MVNVLQQGGLRAALGALAVSCVVGGVGVAGAAEPQAADVSATAANTWNPSTVEIQTGETVTWHFASGSGIPHNVDGVSGPPEDADWPNYVTQFQSTGEVSRTFTQPGTYTFVCDAHPGMTGSVTVSGAPATPTPSATATPTATPTASPTPSPTARPSVSVTPAPATGMTTPAPAGTARLDTTAPTTTLRLKAIKRGTRVTFRLSEPASVTIRVRHGRSTTRTVRLAARAGTRSINVRRLRRGRHYRVELSARDARGNVSRLVRKTVKVVR
jgi:plastocyanin